MKNLIISLRVWWIMFQAKRVARKNYKEIERDMKKAGLL
jgi:hypothetical protein